MDHQIEQQADGRYRCTVCGWTWKQNPVSWSSCPGVHRYDWQTAPENLKTQKQLRQLHLKPGGSAAGCIKGKEGFYYLYDQAQAVPVRPISEKQRAALARGREMAGTTVCPVCHERVPVQYMTRGICIACDDRMREENARIRDEEAREEAVQQAQAWLAMGDQAVVLDTETTGLEAAEIVEIAVLGLDDTVLLETRVRPRCEIEPSAFAVHGISMEMLAGAPTFPEIYPRLAEILTGRTVITYNADFDHQVVDHCCHIHQLDDIPAKAWECAMHAYAAYFGEWSRYFGSYKWQPLWDGDHSAAGDCRTTIDRIRRMAGVPEPGAP